MIAETRGAVSLSGPIEVQMGHSVPPVKTAIDHGREPSLRVDVECNQPGDFFGQMRATFGLQRTRALLRAFANEPMPRPLTTREVIKWAAANGAAVNGLGARIGPLTPGKQANMVPLSTDLINAMLLNNAYGAIVLGMDTSNVDTVLVGGRFVKYRRQLDGVDRQRLQQDLNGSREHVLLSAKNSLSPTAPTICNHHTPASLARPPEP